MSRKIPHRNNRKFTASITAMLFVVSLTGCAASKPTQTDWPILNTPTDQTRGVDIDSRIVEILSEMTLEEKIGQILQPEITNITPDEVREFNIGSVLNGGNGRPNNDIRAKTEDWMALADAYYLASVDTSDGGVGIPIIWGIDAVHGNNGVFGATIFPHNIGLGAANNAKLMEEIGAVTATETAAIGLDWTFAPTLAVARDDRWGRTYESFSEDPKIVSNLGKSYVRGLQGDVSSKETFFSRGKIIATAKHFIADGGTENGRDQGSAHGSTQTLVDIHAPAYFTALEAGAQTVMASYSSWNGTRMHGEKNLLTGVLKQQLGFDGFVIGDFNGHAMIPGCSNGDCPQALLAGIDMYMVPRDWKPLYNSLLAQVRDGTIPMDRLDDAVARIIRVKLRAGLFNMPQPSQRLNGTDGPLIGHADHRAIARRAVRESLVLLKNNDGVLPINPSSNILVAGLLADSVPAQAGGWSLTWQGTGLSNEDFPGSTSILSGIEETVSTFGGTVKYSPKGDFKNRPDVAIVVFGETPYAEYQGDLETLKFQATGGNSYSILKKLKAENIPVVSVFLSGRPLWTNNYINQSDAFVAAWLPGTEGGGVADVLIGDKNGSARHDFKGKLSFSWPKFANQYSLNKGSDDYNPLFEIGYGLTSAEKLVVPKLTENSGLSAAEQQFTDPNSLFVEGRTVAPWRLYVGDSGDSRMKTEGERLITSVKKAIFLESVDYRRQEDAKKILWNGTENASVFILGYRPTNMVDAAQSGKHIVMDYKVLKQAEATVTFKLGCGGKCEQTVDATSLFSDVLTQEWRSASIPLMCFADGVDFSKVDRPFHLETTGRMEIELYSTKLGDASGHVLPCDALEP